MTDLAVLGGSAAKFAAENDLALVPVVPDHGDVHIAAGVMELPAFLASRPSSAAVSTLGALDTGVRRTVIGRWIDPQDGDR